MDFEPGGGNRDAAYPATDRKEINDQIICFSTAEMFMAVALWVAVIAVADDAFELTVSAKAGGVKVLGFHSSKFAGSTVVYVGTGMSPMVVPGRLVGTGTVGTWSILKTPVPPYLLSFIWRCSGPC